MKIEKIKNLEDKILEKSYTRSNKNTRLIWNSQSISFQVINILISFFGVYYLLNSFIEQNFPLKSVFFGFISILILSFWEVIKRMVSINLFFDILKKKPFNILNIILVLFLVVGSGFIAIKSITEITENTDVNKNNLVSTYEKNQYLLDSTHKSNVDTLTKQLNILIKKQNGYLYSSDTIRVLTKKETQLINQLNKDIDLTKQSLSKLNSEHTDKKNTLKTEYLTQLSKISEKKNSNIFILLFITLFIETMIMVGIYNVVSFDFKAFNEIYNSDSYNKYNRYLNLLKVIYQNGLLKENDVLLPETKILDYAKLNDKNIKQIDIKDFIKFLGINNIIKLNKNNRVILKSYTEAIELIKKLTYNY